MSIIHGYEHTLTVGLRLKVNGLLNKIDLLVDGKRALNEVLLLWWLRECEIFYQGKNKYMCIILGNSPLPLINIDLSPLDLAHYT